SGKSARAAAPRTAAPVVAPAATAKAAAFILGEVGATAKFAVVLKVRAALVCRPFVLLERGHVGGLSLVARLLVVPFFGSRPTHFLVAVRSRGRWLFSLRDRSRFRFGLGAMRLMFTLGALSADGRRHREAQVLVRKGRTRFERARGGIAGLRAVF